MDLRIIFELLISLAIPITVAGIPAPISFSSLMPTIFERLFKRHVETGDRK